MERPAIRLSVCRADEFPSGIQAAWERLEDKVGSLRGRKFYGITMPQDEQLVDYAGVEPRDEEEITVLGFPTLEMKEGNLRE